MGPAVSPLLRLRWRPFVFSLPQPMVTAQGTWRQRRGWLLRLEAPDGRLGWGEAGAPWPSMVATGLTGAGRTRDIRTGRGSIGHGRAGTGMAGSGILAGGIPLVGMIGSGLAEVPDAEAMAAAAASPQPVAMAFPEQPGPWAEGLAALAPHVCRADLEACLPHLPAPMAFALGSALAELDGQVGSAEHPWRAAPPSAWLLPAGETALEALRTLLAWEEPTADTVQAGPAAPGGATPLITPPRTVKWKVAAHPDSQERRVLEELLALLPPTARLRLDANGGWDRPIASAWADRLTGESRLEWLEQPLPPSDQEGLDDLAQRIPVALDESLRVDPSLRERWPGWQVRRPALEGDPRPLLAELRAGRPQLMLSTALESGIGRRWVGHLAALQAAGPTPTAPGLAPGWTPQGSLFAADPAAVWEAAA